MKTHLTVPATGTHRRAVMAALAALTVLIGVAGFHETAWPMETIDHPASVLSSESAALPIITAPAPAPAGNDDDCLPLLHSVRYISPPSEATATDPDRHSAGKAAAIGLVFGVRFALGPRETPGQRRKGNAVRFDVWQPREGNDLKAMAVADYRRCKNEQALKAISDWRWAR